ncbi:unnamed protein product [Heterobilharzia americana]|nr:unnamed protein product [Heterobilharzia americana]
MSHSKTIQPSNIETNYESVSVVVEPVEVAAAGEAQAELDERDKQVLHSLLMHKTPTIVSSVPVNNFSYTPTNASMTPMKAISSNTFVSHSQTTTTSTNQSPTPVLVLSSFNSSSHTPDSTSNSTLHTYESVASSTIAKTTTKQHHGVHEINRSNFNADITLNQPVQNSVTSSRSNHSSSFLNGSFEHTEMEEQKTTPLFTSSTQPKLDTAVSKVIPSVQSVKPETVEHVRVMTGSSIQPIVTHSVSVVTAKRNILPDVNNDIEKLNNTSPHEEHNNKPINHMTSLYAPQPYEAVTVTTAQSTNSTNDIKSVDESTRIPSSSPLPIPTSDSFQSRIKPPSFAVKTTSDSTRQLSIPKTTSTTVKIEETTSIMNSKHVVQSNSMSNSLYSPENIKNHSKVELTENENMPFPPLLCSTSVSVTGIRPPSGIKAPSITPDKMKSRTPTTNNNQSNSATPTSATNGHAHSSPNTSVTSMHDDEITYNKQNISAYNMKQTCDTLKSHDSKTIEDSSEHLSSLPKLSGNISSVHGKTQSKLRPVAPMLSNLPIANSGIPAPSILPPSNIVGQSHMPIPVNSTSIPLPSGIRPPSRSPKSALAK